jgi:DNA-binding MurR/RpiR family transcriptional regulator
MEESMRFLSAWMSQNNGKGRYNEFMIIDQVLDILNSGEKDSALYAFCLYVEGNVMTVPDQSIDETARACYLSKAAVSKCVRLLHYENFKEFKDACRSCRTVLERHPLKRHAGPGYDLKAYLERTAQETLTAAQAVQSDLEQLCLACKKASCIYLAARGDARSCLYFMQHELVLTGRRSVICDGEFRRPIRFHKDDLLIHISTSGDSFLYDPRVVQRIEKADVKKVLITCGNMQDVRYDQIIRIKGIPRSDQETVIRSLMDLLMQYVSF